MGLIFWLLSLTFLVLKKIFDVRLGFFKELMIFFFISLAILFFCFFIHIRTNETWDKILKKPLCLLCLTNLQLYPYHPFYKIKENPAIKHQKKKNPYTKYIKKALTNYNKRKCIIEFEEI